MHLRMQQIVKTNWVLTGADSPQSNFGIQKSRFECVHAGTAKPLRTLRCPLGIKNVDLSNQVGVFDLLSATDPISDLTCPGFILDN